MMKKLLWIPVVLTLLILGCETGENLQWFLYEETQCADPWNTGLGSNESEVSNAVIQYFNDLNVSILEVQLDSLNEGEACDACFCLSGRGIRIKADANDAAIIENENFIAQ